MRRTIWRACGIVVLGAMGFGTAYALTGSATAAIPTTTSVTLPTVTVPTVTVPTLPTTTTVTVPPLPTTTVVTVPPLPTTTVVTVPSLPVTTAVTPPALPPAPSVPVPSPPAPLPTAPRAPAPNPPPRTTSSPTGSDAVAPSAPTASSAGSTGESDSSGTRSAETQRSSGRARVARFDLSRDRFANRGKQRGSTVIRFQLSRAARLVLVVRGPGPSCATVARIARRGRAGANRLRFDGRIAGRPLEPGTYLLTLRVRGRTADLGRAFVTIVAPGAPATARTLPECTDAGPARTFLDGQEGAGTRSARLVLPTTALQPPSAREDVRGEESPLFAAPPPWPRFDDADRVPALLGLALLALIVASLLGIVVEVVRHLRSPQA